MVLGQGHGCFLSQMFLGGKGWLWTFSKVHFALGVALSGAKSSMDGVNLMDALDGALERNQAPHVAAKHPGRVSGQMLSRQRLRVVHVNLRCLQLWCLGVKEVEVHLELGGSRAVFSAQPGQPFWWYLHQAGGLDRDVQLSSSSWWDVVLQSAGSLYQPGLGSELTESLRLHGGHSARAVRGTSFFSFRVDGAPKGASRGGQLGVLLKQEGWSGGSS